MKNLTDLICGLILLGLCAIGYKSVMQLPSAGALEGIGPAAVPKASLFILAALSIILIVKSFFQKPARPYWPSRHVLLKLFLFLLLFFLYMAMLVYFGDWFADMEHPPLPSGNGFALSTLLFLLMALPLLGRRSILEIVTVAVMTTASLLIVFGWFFKVLLP